MADFSAIQEASKLDERVADIPIYQKNGDPYLAADGTPATIGVTGSDAKAYKLEKQNVQRELIRQGKKQMEPADIERRRIRMASAAIQRWHGWEANGKPFDCTKDNAKALLSIEHILEQVEEGITGHASFFTSAAVN